MALTPLDIHNKEFNVRFRGYDQDQVNDFLDQIIKDYEAALKHNDELQRSLKDSQEKVAYFTDLKDALNQSIIVAQDAADKVKTNAQREAQIIQDDAEKQARQLLNESTDKSNQILQDASEKARQITIETDDLKKQTRIFRQRLQVMLESQLEIVKSPEWNELLNDDQMDNNNTSLNQQLHYSNNQNYNSSTDTQGNYNDYSDNNLAQDYNFSDTSDNQYTTYDNQTTNQNMGQQTSGLGQSQSVQGDSDNGTATSNASSSTVNANNVGSANSQSNPQDNNLNFGTGPDYQFDNTNSGQNTNATGSTSGQNRASDTSNSDLHQQAPVHPLNHNNNSTHQADSRNQSQSSINPGDSSNTQQMATPPTAQLDPDYFNQNPKQNRPTIVFPDDTSSGKINDNHQNNSN